MKKQARIIILAVLLAVLISFGANAALTDVFRAGLGPLEDFFSGGWRDYEKTLAFVVFFFMFFSVYMIGMKSPSGKKFFGDKLSRPHMVFAFTIALLSSFIIVVSTRFDWINLKYIAWFLLGFLGFYILYSLLSKLLGKKKFWAFLLALLLTLLLLWLFWYLVGQGRPLESFGGIGDWFEDVGAGDRVEPGPPIVDPGQAQPPAAQPPPPAGGVDEGWLNMGNLGKGGLGLGGLIILILLLMFLKKKKGHVTPPGQTKAPGEEAQGAGIGPSQEAARTAAGQPPTIDNAAEVFLALLKKLIKIQDVIMKGFNEKIRRDLLFPKEVSKGYKFPDDSPAWFYSRENRKETEILRREIEDFIEDNRQLMQVIREAMQLDFKEMESLKYLAKKLEGEERSLTKSYGYYRNLNYQNYNRNITNQYDKNKSYVPLSIPSHLRDFEIRPELKGGIRLQLIRIDQELEAYFVKNLAPVLLRLYQLFKEFEEVLIKEQKVLDNLKIISNRLPAEGEMGEVDQELKDNLGNYIRAFVDIVKKKEWILYKNLEKDHDDKAQAEKELEAEILKRRGVEERGKKGGSWGGLGGTAPDFSNIRLVIKEPKTGSSHYIGDPIKRLDVEVIDLRTNQVIQGFSEGEGYEYGWVITGQNGERHRIFRKKSTLKSGETTLPVSDRLEAGEATLTVYLSKGEFNTKSEDMIIFLKDKGGRGTDSRRKTPDSHKIGLRINEPKANSTYYLGDPIKRLDVEVIDSRTNEIIKGFNEKEGYNYYWTIIDGAGYEETICVKRSTLSGGESFDIPKDLEAGPAKLRVLLYKGRSLIISEGINIILENKIKGGYIGVLRSSETEPPCEIYIDPSKKITIGKNEGNIHLVDGDFNDEIQAYIRYNGTVYLINKIGGSSTKMKIDDSDSSFHIFLKNATISIGNYNFLFELVNYNEEVHKIDLSNALLDKGVVLRLKNALKIKKIFPKEAYVEKGKNIILIDCDNLTKDSDATIGDQKLEGMEFLEQQIKGYIPPGKEGPADVRVWNEYGEDVVRGGFTYLPGEEKVGILKPLNCKPDEELYLDPYKYCEKFNPREDTSPYPLRIFYGLGVQDYILK